MAFMCTFTVDSVITSSRAMILFDAPSSAKSPAPVATGFSARPLPASTAHQGLHRSFADHARSSGWSLPNFVARKRKLLIVLSVPLKLDVNCL
jgi:hypothetical protein